MVPVNDYEAHTSYICGIIETSKLSSLWLRIFWGAWGNVLLTSKSMESEGRLSMIVIVAITP